jgi:simple sugar transport system permease protein
MSRLRLPLVVLAVTLAVLVPVALLSDEPGVVMFTFLLGPASSLRHAGNVLEAATPLFLTGLAAAVVFRSGLFNLGVEGSAFLGGLGAAATAILLPLPAPVALPVALMGGMAFGVWACAVPGALRLVTGASEMVTSLVLNFAFLFLGVFFLKEFLRDPTAGFLASYRLPEAATFDRLLRGTRLHAGLFVGLVLCILVAWWLRRSRGGLALTVTGASSRFGAHVGLPVRAVLMRAQVAGGLIAGLAGAVEVLGLYDRFTWTELPGLGWNGIVVAILARNEPLLVIPAAIFVAWLRVGGEMLARGPGVPAEVAGLVTAAILVGVTATALIGRRIE